MIFSNPGLMNTRLIFLSFDTAACTKKLRFVDVTRLN